MTDLDTSNIFFYPAKPGQNAIQNMHTHFAEEPGGRLFAMGEKWKLIYNENHRSPNYSVSHYITYLKRYVETTNQLRAIVSGKTTERFSRKGLYDRAETRSSPQDTQRSLDSISPMSYFIRKLKLDLKLAFVGFVEEFSQAPNNGQRLLLQLLKNLQLLAAMPGGGLFMRGGTRGTLKMEEYKQNMIDGQDCLLCIKYSLRAKKAGEELLDNNGGLLTVALCVLSNFSRSRITALEILTLLLSGPSAVDRVLEAFTSVRIIHAESCRFKMLVNMLYTRGVSQVLFQVTCLRLLNTLLNLCKSANMRVFLQYEMEEAGLDIQRLQQNTSGDGLEFDDLRKEIWEWKMRYIDVDAILRKMKVDLKVDAPGSALTEFNYDQHFGQLFGSPSSRFDNSNTTVAENGPHTNAVSLNREKSANPNFQVNAGGQSGRNPNVSQRSGPVIPMHLTPNTSNTTIITDHPGHSGKHSGGQSELEILSRAASPTNPKPTHALVDPRSREKANVAEFDLGGFASAKAELWEPYGMVIDSQPAQQTRSSSSEKLGGTHKIDNWVLTSSQSSHPPNVNIEDGRSNLSFISGEEGGKLKIKEKEHTPNGNQDTSKLFYSPKTSGIDGGPLKWFNPGITLPDPSREAWTQSVSEQYPERSKTAQLRYNRNPQTPSPDYTCTPPPDYNDSDFDEHLEESSYRPQKYSVPQVTTNIEYKRRSENSNTHRKSNGPYSTSTIKSNFQRWPAVRRKSFSEVSLPKPSSILEETTEFPSEHPESPPPLPPPRIVYAPNVKISLTSFSSGNPLETARMIKKSSDSKLLRHSQSKPNVERIDSSEKPVPDKNNSKNVAAITRENPVPHRSSLDQDAGKPQNPESNSSIGDYAPGITTSRSSNSYHTPGESNQPYLQQNKSPNIGGVQKSSPISTIIITSNKKSITQSNSRLNDTVREDHFMQNDDAYLESDKSAINEKINHPSPTAITITSPTPPQTMSGTKDAVHNKNSLNTSAVENRDDFEQPYKPCQSNKPSSYPSQRGSTTKPENKANIDCADTKASLKSADKQDASELDNVPVHDSIEGYGESDTRTGTGNVMQSHTRQDSVLSYTSEIGRVLGDLDHTLETHGWQASLKQQARKPNPPLVAYV